MQDFRLIFLSFWYLGICINRLEFLYWLLTGNGFSQLHVGRSKGTLSCLYDVLERQFLLGRGNTWFLLWPVMCHRVIYLIYLLGIYFLLSLNFYKGSEPVVSEGEKRECWWCKRHLVWRKIVRILGAREAYTPVCRERSQGSCHFSKAVSAPFTQSLLHQLAVKVSSSFLLLFHLDFCLYRKFWERLSVKISVFIEFWDCFCVMKEWDEVILQFFCISVFSEEANACMRARGCRRSLRLCSLATAVCLLRTMSIADNEVELLLSCWSETWRGKQQIDAAFWSYQRK